MERRSLLQMGVAAAVLVGAGGLAARPLWQRFADQSLTFDDLMAFEASGQVTLIHFCDLHSQITPIYFREPSTNVGVGAAAGLVPHLTGQQFADYYDLKAGSPEIHALTSLDFEALAASYGKVGGVDRMATIIDRIQAERPGKTLLLDSGDTWHGSYITLQNDGADMVQVSNALGVDAMASHFEFTLGQETLEDRISEFDGDFLAGNVRDVEWDEAVFEAYKVYERNGIRIAVVGQAFPYTAIANPKWMFESYGFGIQLNELKRNVAQARAKADLVVLLSHNGFDVDRKVASEIDGIDVILSGHTHDAIPVPEQIGKTLLVASGSNGKFVSRLDLDVGSDGIKNFSYSLVPVFADVVPATARLTGLVDSLRAPYASHLDEVVGQTNGALYRRGNLNGTMDDLICDALLSQREAEIALSPGFRWGPSLIPGQNITREDIYDHTAITYPQAYRQGMTGEMIKVILEDVADNLFHPDPFFQQGGDMVRVGGIGFDLRVTESIGNRISNLRKLDTGEPLEASKEYVVAGWGSINEGTEGPAAWDVIFDHLKENPEVDIAPNESVRLV